MQYLFEYSDKLNSPFEAFLFDTTREVFPIRPHWHYFMELIYMLDGTALVNCDQETYILRPGDLILFHPQAVHSVYTTTNSPLKYEVIKFDINQLNVTNSYTPKLSHVFRKAKDDETANIYFAASDLQGIPVQELFSLCLKEMGAKPYGYDLLINSNLCALLIQLLRIWRSNGFDTDTAVIAKTETESIHSITEYIDYHSSEPLKVQELAEKCGMSYSYFAKEFKYLYNQSCKEYIDFIRVCKAEDLLLFTNFDLTFISQETGFFDCSHLIKVFKKHKGITPKQFALAQKRQVKPD